MKKIVALLLAVMMVMALCACGSTEEAAEEAVVEAPAAEGAAPAAEASAVAPAAEGDASGEMGAASGEMGAASGEMGTASGEMGTASGEMAADDSASAEAGGAQAGNFVDLSVNAVIPTAAAPETYTADEAGWQNYMMDCAYYAMGTSDGDNKLGSTYYDITVGNMTDMFVNMWGVDAMDAFIANGGVPTVNPWTLSEGQGTPDTVPDAEETAE